MKALGSLDAVAVRRAWNFRQEIALFDLREESAYATGHPLFAASLPLGSLESEILDRVPRKDTCIVLYDNAEGRVTRAAEALQALGYTSVYQLEGDIKAWRSAGFQLFSDVNSASKAFGELVAERRETPMAHPIDVKRLIDEGEDLVVLDARTPREYSTMSIPSAASVPGADLVLRARAAAPSPSTTIIVNCAGRTRSIVGAQSLINAGMPNPVWALENGTIGWMLAGQTLNQGADLQVRLPDLAGQKAARKAAKEVSYAAGVITIGLEDFAHLNDPARTLYRFDVRSLDEYQRGHIPGFRSVPGGQLVQETDVFAPVRGARIVLADDLGVRAHMTASWLSQMNWEVLVLDVAADAFTDGGPWRSTLPPLPRVALIGVEALAKAKPVVIDLSTSAEHRRGHIPGAYFVLRAELRAAVARLPKGPIVLTSSNGDAARFAAAEFAYADISVSVLEGGTEAWRAAGYPMEAGIERPLSSTNDGYRRPYEGVDNPSCAMQAYLDWEFGLVEQLAKDGSHGFRIL